MPRFHFASISFVKRKAKALKRALADRGIDMPLGRTQDALAVLCGYVSFHELYQVTTSKAVAPTELDLFAPDINAASRLTGIDAALLRASVEVAQINSAAGPALAFSTKAVRCTPMQTERILSDMGARIIKAVWSGTRTVTIEVGPNLDDERLSLIRAALTNPSGGYRSTLPLFLEPAVPVDIRDEDDKLTIALLPEADALDFVRVDDTDRAAFSQLINFFASLGAQRLILHGASQDVACFTALYRRYAASRQVSPASECRMIIEHEAPAEPSPSELEQLKSRSATITTPELIDMGSPDLRSAFRSLMIDKNTSDLARRFPWEITYLGIDRSDAGLIARTRKHNEIRDTLRCATDIKTRARKDCSWTTLDSYRNPFAHLPITSEARFRLQEIAKGPHSVFISDSVSLAGSFLAPLSESREVSLKFRDAILTYAASHTPPSSPGHVCTSISSFDRNRLERISLEDQEFLQKGGRFICAIASPRLNLYALGDGARRVHVDAVAQLCPHCKTDSVGSWLSDASLNSVIDCFPDADTHGVRYISPFGCDMCEHTGKIGLMYVVSFDQPPRQYKDTPKLPRSSDLDALVLAGLVDPTHHIQHRMSASQTVAAE